MIFSEPHGRRIRDKMRKEGSKALCIEHLSILPETVESILGQLGIAASCGESEIQADGIEWTSNGFSLTGYDLIGGRISTVDLLGSEEQVESVRIEIERAT
jgi:hypothetical protein